ncbi:MAG: TonB family protein [Blastocatellia bacterium]|nr:TonB family protein [Blastocatellia bacterium]
MENIAAATKVPTGISSVPNTAPTAPIGKFEIGAINRDSSDGGDIGRRPSNSGSENASTEPAAEEVQLAEIADPPPVRRPPVIKSKGVINGEAKSLPVPTYPAIARAAGAGGLVRVQVTLDESGKVISASVVDGHPMLRRSAETAARAARFTPTLLSGVPVKVTGEIVYNFVR